MNEDIDIEDLRRNAFGTQYCPDCGGNMTWCTLCEVYTKTCCVEYGTCLCN